MITHCLPSGAGEKLSCECCSAAINKKQQQLKNSPHIIRSLIIDALLGGVYLEGTKREGIQ